MDAINPTYVLIFLTVVAVLYAAWMVYFTMRESRRANGKERKGKETTSSSDGKVRKVEWAKANLSSKRAFRCQKPP